MLELEFVESAYADTFLILLGYVGLLDCDQLQLIGTPSRDICNVPAPRFENQIAKQTKILKKFEEMPQHDETSLLTHGMTSVILRVIPNKCVCVWGTQTTTGTFTHSRT